MKIEKISDNKLKIALTKQELIDKNIDIYSINKLNLEDYDLFLDIFEEAQAKCDFNLTDSPLLIEGAINSNDLFILTITKMSKDKSNISNFPKVNNPKIKVSRKYPKLENQNLIYCFTSFDNFIDFCFEVKKIPTKYLNSLYLLKDKYYLVFNNLHLNETLFKNTSSMLSDFGDYVPYPNMFHYKLKEYGEIIIEENAINTIKEKYKINK